VLIQVNHLKIHSYNSWFLRNKVNHQPIHYFFNRLRWVNLHLFNYFHHYSINKINRIVMFYLLIIQIIMFNNPMQLHLIIYNYLILQHQIYNNLIQQQHLIILIIIYLNNWLKYLNLLHFLDHLIFHLIYQLIFLKLKNFNYLKNKLNFHLNNNNKHLNNHLNKNNNNNNHLKYNNKHNNNNLEINKKNNNSNK
jgi:hypothetical protein